MDYMYFGVKDGHLNERARRLAERHGAVIINYEEKSIGFGTKRWCTFAVPFRGHPYDDDVKKSVLGAIERAGGIEKFRKTYRRGT